MSKYILAFNATLHFLKVIIPIIYNISGVKIDNLNNNSLTLEQINDLYNISKFITGN